MLEYTFRAGIVNEAAFSDESLGHGGLTPGALAIGKCWRFLGLASWLSTHDSGYS